VRAIVAGFVLLGLLSTGSTTGAQTIVCFEGQFDGPTLDPSTWRTDTPGTAAVAGRVLPLTGGTRRRTINANRSLMMGPASRNGL